MTRLLAVFLSAVCLAAPAAAQESGDVFVDQEAEMARIVREGQAPSLVAAAIDGSQMVWIHTEGFSDIEARVLATPDTIYRIGSVSKSITATVLAIAARDNARALSGSVCIRTLALRGRSCDVSIADLLNMSVGMPQAVRYPGIHGLMFAERADDFIAQYAFSVTGVSDRYDYSNLGPALAARELERATNQPFSEIARRSLFGPLGLDATYMTMRDAPPHARAASYTRSGTRFTHDFEVEPVVSAGMVSSLRDLISHARLHLRASGTLQLTAAEVEMLHQPGRSGFYGFGWGRIMAAGTEFLISDGQVNGGQAIIVLQPEHDAAVIVMSNAAFDGVNGLALSILEQMHPGAGAAFEQGVAAIEASLARPTPELDDGEIRGQLHLSGRELPLRLTVRGQQVRLRLRGGSEIDGDPTTPDAGYLRWSIPCPSEIPTCAAGDDAEATLALTRTTAGLAGYIAVSSRRGLFPYAVTLE